VKFDGVLHEFSTIPGVKEDVTDIILNLKGVRVKLNQEGPRQLRLDIAREGIVTAGDILHDGTVEILNPEHHIATLSGEAVLKADMVVLAGRGYLPAKKEKDYEQPEGTINIDAISRPSKRSITR
jgi:DNA-directed RNA polymerase subunit alpha